MYTVFFQKIGEPAGKNGCEDSHFHLAMKRTMDDEDSNLCYYVDPSPFLDRMQPIPKWHQECKDFTFKHIGDVIDFSKLSKGYAAVVNELARWFWRQREGSQLMVNSCYLEHENLYKCA